jgi:chemotaxis protein MotA
VSSSAIAMKDAAEQPGVTRRSRIDFFMLAGIAVALAATIAGIAATGVKLSYFLQPTGALIVLGGTLGITIITTPRLALLNSGRRVLNLIWTPEGTREALIEEIMSYVKVARTKGLFAIEPTLSNASNSFLEEALRSTVDMQERADLKALLETKLRLRERQGETDAKTLEVAGGFAPTIGVLGTVVGLIDVLRQFSNVSAVAGGVGTAFISTIYGLGLANLLLLPAAHRIRSRVAETFEMHELMIEGALCIFDGLHPSLVRERLNAFLRETHTK